MHVYIQSTTIGDIYLSVSNNPKFTVTLDAKRRHYNLYETTANGEPIS